jgi:hypothetical protein
MYSKIKWDGSQVTLCWADRPNAKRNETHELTSSEEPAPEFLAAMRAFVPWVLACLGVTTEALGLDKDPTRLEIRGVSRTDSELGGCVVTALLSTSVSSAPMVINTPHVAEARSGDSASPILPDYVLDALVNLDRWAAKYHKGERAQSDLFPSTEEPRPPKTASVEEQAFVRDMSALTSQLTTEVALRAVADLAPKKGESIESVTLSSGGKSVTLTSETGENARRALRLVKQPKKPVASSNVDPRD